LANGGVPGGLGSKRKAYVVNGDVSLVTGGGAPRYKTTLYVNGSVTIDGNLPVDPRTASDLGLRVVTLGGGNISINPNVTQIGGAFSASGQLSTCGSGAQGDEYNRCANKLTVYGRLIANQLLLLRTGGPLGSIRNANPNDTAASNYAGEVIIMNSQPYLPQPSVGGVDSITQLNPLL
jgi:hypothetical protein